MKRVFFYIMFFFLSVTASYSQLQIGGGPALFLIDKFWEEQYGSVDYTLLLGYSINKFDVGFEFVQNGYKNEGNGKDYYEFYQYQLFGRFFPLKKRSWFVKTGINYSDEKYHNTIKEGGTSELIKLEEYGKLLGLEGGIGYQDRLIRKLDLYLNVSLTYNYLYVLEDGYYFNSNKTPTSFYALKASLIYQFNLRKPTTK